MNTEYTILVQNEYRILAQNEYRIQNLSAKQIQNTESLLSMFVDIEVCLLTA